MTHYILSAVSLVWMLVGLARLARPKRHMDHLWKKQARQFRKREPERQLPESAAAIPGLEGALKQRARISGAGWFLLGLAGFMASGPALSFSGDRSMTWVESNAPHLGEIVRKHSSDYLRRNRGVGLAVAAISGTNRCLMTFGRMAASGGPVNGDTLFEIGSITKAFTGIALARHIESGDLNLNDSIAPLMPPDVAVADAAGKVTLQHLTTHTSGFPRMPGNMPVTARFKMLFGGDPYRDYSETSFHECLARLELEADPGLQWNYSNLASGLLGYLLAGQHGTSYEAMILGQVCQPLGMNDTHARLDDDRRTRLAQGYRATLQVGPLMFGLRSSPWELPNHLAGAGALRSSIKDMAAFLEANMYPGNHPIGPALRRSQAEQYRRDETLSMGMNWIRRKTDAQEYAIVWHNGGTGGFHSYLGFLEGGDIGVVVLSNKSESVDYLGVVLIQAMVDHLESMKTVTVPRGIKRTDMLISTNTWRCPNCSHRHPDIFSMCWRCNFLKES